MVNLIQTELETFSKIIAESVSEKLGKEHTYIKILNFIQILLLLSILIKIN